MHADGGGVGADVWACGVLLFVMLLGAFPFEHSTSSAADEQRAFNEVHFEQIRIHWTENERNRDIVQVPPPTNSSCVLQLSHNNLRAHFAQRLHVYPIHLSMGTCSFLLRHSSVSTTQSPGVSDGCLPSCRPTTCAGTAACVCVLARSCVCCRQIAVCPAGACGDVAACGLRQRSVTCNAPATVLHTMLNTLAALCAATNLLSMSHGRRPPETLMHAAPLTEPYPACQSPACAAEYVP